MDLSQKKEINHLLKTAQSACKLVLEYYNNHTDLEIESKNDNSPVTIADKKSSDLIIKSLHELNNRIPVISEENPDAQNLDIIKKHKTYWLIDPIDGTWSFIKKKGYFTVNIALIKNGEPIWGLVASPLDNSSIYYIDHEDHACKLSDGKTKLLKPKKIYDKGFDFLVSHQNLNQKTQDLISKFKIQTITPIASSIKLAFMAEGIGHIYPRYKPTCIWDTAAGHALLKRIGGEVFDATTMKPLRYNNSTLLNPNFIAVSDIGIKFN